MSRRGLLLALLVGVLSLALSSTAAAEDAPCLAAPAFPAFELVYSPQPGEEAVDARTRGEAVAILCARLQSSEIAGQVSLVSGGRIRVVLPALPRTGDLGRLAGQLGVSGQLRFYDWEPNLIGPEQALGGHPGSPPPPRALRRLEREWTAAGRGVERPENKRLILAGAFPGPYGAVRLAAKQSPRADCRACSASGPRFYLFDRSPAHDLIAGPVAHRAELRRGPHRRDLVLKVPIGTLIASEPSTNSAGVPLRNGEPGWFALRDRAALTNADIVRPQQEMDELGQPSVTFGFTPRGRAAFQRVTRRIARRGSKRAKGLVTVTQAEALSGHFALIFDGEVKTRPIINFAYNPDGIDGRSGAQIAGGFSTKQEARDLAWILRTKPLPIELALVRQRKPAG